MNTNRYLIKDEMDNEYVLPFLTWLINNTTFSDDSVLIQLFEYLNELPGTKLLLKGNHDYCGKCFVVCFLRRFFVAMLT